MIFVKSWLELSETGQKKLSFIVLLCATAIDISQALFNCNIPAANGREARTEIAESSLVKQYPSDIIGSGNRSHCSPIYV